LCQQQPQPQCRRHRLKKKQLSQFGVFGPSEWLLPPQTDTQTPENSSPVLCHLHKTQNRALTQGGSLLTSRVLSTGFSVQAREQNLIYETPVSTIENPPQTAARIS
jgi:hypothetical protein